MAGMFGGGGFEDRFAGGGFMASQQDQGGAGSGGKGRQQKDQTLRAVTIRQLAGAASSADAELVVDGADLSNVTLVGKVISADERGGNIDLHVSDGTGVINVTYYVENAESDPQAMAQKMAELRPGTYVRVYGHLRSAQGNWSVSSFAVRVVHDFNEVTYHCLQAIFQHIHLLKGAGTGTGGAAAPAQQQGNGYSGPAAGGWQQQQQAPQQHGGYGGGAPAAGPPGMDPCAQAVLQVVSDPNAGDQGVHVNDIAARLAGRFSRGQVDAALNFLQNEAHAYTTCDENHWRAT